MTALTMGNTMKRSPSFYPAAFIASNLVTAKWTKTLTKSALPQCALAISLFAGLMPLPASAYNWQPVAGETAATADEQSGFGQKYSTIGLEPRARLTLEDKRAPIDGVSERLIKEICQGPLRTLTDIEIHGLQSILPTGYPQPAELLTKEMEVPEQGKVKAAGGQYRKLAGKDAIALWTLTKGLSVCEPTATGSRRLLKLQLDYWLLKPLSTGQIQLIHLQVDSPGNPFSETRSLEEFVQQASITTSDQMEFKSSEGKIIATALSKQEAGIGQLVELKLSLLRRIGTKPIPYFVSTVPGAYNPQLLSDKSWRAGDKQVMVLITSPSADRQTATVLAFDHYSAKVTQTLAGTSITPAVDLEQKGLIIKELISDSGYSRPRFYFFSNAADKLVEMVSLRSGLAAGELESIKYKTLLAGNCDARTKLAIAVLMLDSEGELAQAATPLLQELRTSPVIKQDKLLYQTIKKALQQIDREQKAKGK